MRPAAALPPAAPPRWPRALALLGVVVLAHAALLGLLPVGVGEGSHGDVRRMVTVRQIVLAPPVAAEAPPATALPPKPKATARVAATAPPVAASAPEVPLPPPPAAEPAPPAPTPAPVETAAAATATAVTEPAPLPAAEGGGLAPPVYPTKPPPPALLRYEMRRGALRGSAELAWRSGPDGYEITLEGTAFSLPVIAWTSRGAFDAAGLAPERFVDRRLRRAPQAANFQREAGRITFSGPAVEYPLVAGAQDRLSWMLQLAAIVAADPQRLGPGARVTLFVVGARGDADLWTFEADAVGPQDLPAGRAEAALHLHRQPRKPYDTEVDVWLDAARGYLPVRLRLAVPASGDSSEFLLQGVEPR